MKEPSPLQKPPRILKIDNLHTSNERHDQHQMSEYNEYMLRRCTKIIPKTIRVMKGIRGHATRAEYPMNKDPTWLSTKLRDDLGSVKHMSTRKGKKIGYIQPTTAIDMMLPSLEKGIEVNQKHGVSQTMSYMMRYASPHSMTSTEVIQLFNAKEYDCAPLDVCMMNKNNLHIMQPINQPNPYHLHAHVHYMNESKMISTAYEEVIPIKKRHLFYPSDHPRKYTPKFKKPYIPPQPDIVEDIPPTIVFESPKKPVTTILPTEEAKTPTRNENNILASIKLENGTKPPPNLPVVEQAEWYQDSITTALGSAQLTFKLKAMHKDGADTSWVNQSIGAEGDEEVTLDGVFFVGSPYYRMKCRINCNQLRKTLSPQVADKFFFKLFDVDRQVFVQNVGQSRPPFTLTTDRDMIKKARSWPTERRKVPTSTFYFRFQFDPELLKHPSTHYRILFFVYAEMENQNLPLKSTMVYKLFETDIFQIASVPLSLS